MVWIKMIDYVESKEYIYIYIEKIYRGIVFSFDDGCFIDIEGNLWKIKKNFDFEIND